MDVKIPRYFPKKASTPLISTITTAKMDKSQLSPTRVSGEYVEQSSGFSMFSSSPIGDSFMTMLRKRMDEHSVH